MPEQGYESALVAFLVVLFFKKGADAMFKIIIKDADDNNKILIVARSTAQAICATKMLDRAGYNIAYEVVGASERSLYNMRKLGLEV